jgi:hypothetical protein
VQRNSAQHFRESLREPSTAGSRFVVSRNVSDKFFNLLQQDQASDGVYYLFSTNPALNKMHKESANLKEQFGALRTIAGPYVSHTILAETKVAGMFVYQHYFVAYEMQPFSVRIKYYKPGATWMCYGLQFDGDLPDEIQKGADAKLSFEAK